MRRGCPKVTECGHSKIVWSGSSTSFRTVGASRSACNVRDLFDKRLKCPDADIDQQRHERTLLKPGAPKPKSGSNRCAIGFAPRSSRWSARHQLDLFPGDPATCSHTEPWTTGDRQRRRHRRVSQRRQAVRENRRPYVIGQRATDAGDGEDAAGDGKQLDYVSTSISLIMHPRSPRVPTVHMNTRFLSTAQGWFGGGADLTPMLPEQRRQDAPDAVTFHAAMRHACDAARPGLL